MLPLINKSDEHDAALYASPISLWRKFFRFGVGIILGIGTQALIAFAFGLVVFGTFAGSVMGVSAGRNTITEWLALAFLGILGTACLFFLLRRRSPYKAYGVLATLLGLPIIMGYWFYAALFLFG